MKAILRLTSIFLIISHPGLGFTQNEELKALVLEGMTEALQLYDTCHYRTRMDFKYMGDDSVNVRNFELGFRTNPDNILYGYDWEFCETRGGGFCDRWSFYPERMELIIYPDKKIYRRSAQQYINLGDYTEAMRWYFSLDKVYEPFLQASKDDLRLNEIKDGYLLEIENGEHKRKLFVDKKSFLPKHNNYIVTDAGTGFVQVQDVYFYFNENSRTIPDSVLNSDYYIARDYEVIVQERLAEELKVDKRDFSTEDLELLLSYSFVTAQGDTASLIDIKQSYILLDFWFASCLPCLHGMPRVNTLMEKYAGQGLQIRGINCHDMESRKSIVQKLEQKNISVPHFFGSRDLLNTLDISSFPSYMLIFPDRRIEIFEGGIAQVEQALRGIFDK